MDTLRYGAIEARSPKYWALLIGLGLDAMIGVLSAHHMEVEGHVISGMNNQIVWGMPHVFAVFLIVAASGALNVASIASVFGKTEYKPLGRLSALLAIALLAGGLAVLVLDLGRPDRLIVAMTTYNFKSIFAWNILLYTGFFAIVGFYMWCMMDHAMQKFSKQAGLFAFIWRLILTTGTGSIFGFLVARSAYDTAMLAPMFIMMSFALGLAFYIIVMLASYQWSERPVGDLIVNRMRNLLGIFIAAVMYFVAVYHVTNLYATEHHAVEKFLLVDGGIFTQLFWYVQILLGGIVPLALIYAPQTRNCRRSLLAACALVLIGGMAHIYIIIVGGQAFPMEMFPGMEVSSSFFDGEVSAYTPSLWEILLGFGGIAITLLLVTVGVAILDFLPESLADNIVSYKK
ncbi:MAG: polysulfide reductase NrfD [Proteobacteria bacterium]|nr:polysulfide reductase NrfD [Pseudomonadota bacterium]